MPPNERSRLEKSAYVKYWRLTEKLSIGPTGLLLFEGRRVLKKGEIKKCVTKTFNKSKSGGYKKLQKRAEDSYAGISRREILKVTQNDPDFKKFTVKFTNKGVPRPVIAKKV